MLFPLCPKGHKLISQISICVSTTYRIYSAFFPSGLRTGKNEVILKTDERKLNHLYIAFLSYQDVIFSLQKC